MLCRKCGNEMYLDDKDYNFKGNYDNYWACEHCNSSCIEEVRFGETQKEHWYHNENGAETEYTIHRDFIAMGII